MAAKEYPVQLLVYVSREQADALHGLTTNVSAWVRHKIDREIKRAERQRREAQNSEAAK